MGRRLGRAPGTFNAGDTTGRQPFLRLMAAATISILSSLELYRQVPRCKSFAKLLPTR